MIFLGSDDSFPTINNESGDIIAYGNDLSVDRLIAAYQSGIFPWYSSDEPVVWWSPDPRFVLYPDKLKVSKSMRAILNKKKFTITYNQQFYEVMKNCQSIFREGQEGTWIHDEMIRVYTKLHTLGIAKSVEVWLNDELVGGLYGIDLGSIFCGESMFSTVSNASKAGFITFVKENPQFELIDCQVYTDHLSSLGAQEIPRELFLSFLMNRPI